MEVPPYSGASSIQTFEAGASSFHRLSSLVCVWVSNGAISETFQMLPQTLYLLCGTIRITFRNHNDNETKVILSQTLK